MPARPAPSCVPPLFAQAESWARKVPVAPPKLKVWETIGAPNPWVTGRYRMGFEIVREAIGARLRVFIEHDLPEAAQSRRLGLIFANAYARWCTGRMQSVISRRRGSRSPFDRLSEPDAGVEPCAALTPDNIEGIIKPADRGRLACRLSELDCGADLWPHGAGRKIPP